MDSVHLSSFGALALVTTLASLIQGTLGFACQATGLCSIGKVKPFFGDIGDSDGLRAALAARSYKKEVIIMGTTASRLVTAVQATYMVKKLGYEHYLMMSISQQDCAAITKLEPEMGCAWDHFVLPVVGKDAWVVFGAANLYNTRWRTLARAVRLGYNVWMMDSDIILFDDPYRYWKSPPFANYTIIDQIEVLYDEGEYAHADVTNGGLFYIQNAAPNGPAAWLVAEVSDRLLRWIDDDFNTTISQLDYQTHCCYMDQDALADGLSSVLVGRPFFRWSVTRCIGEDINRKDERGEYLKKVHSTVNHYPAYHQAWHSEALPLPDWMAPRAGGRNTTDVRWAWMRMPHTGGQWPAELGGKLYPDRRGGGMAAEFQRLLREDCRGCPMWPDPEDPASEAAARATSPEPFLFAPLWLVTGMFVRGRVGYWHLSSTGLPQQVIGHAHYLPGTDASVGKVVMKMMFDDYDWGVAHKMLGEGVYFASQGKKADADPTPMLLAYHPSVQLGLTNSWQERVALLQGLAQVAVVLGRTVLWPDQPLNTSWVDDGNGVQATRALPMAMGHRSEWLCYGPTWEDQMCTYLPGLTESCMFRGRGLSSHEFRHYRARLRLQHELEPSPYNTFGLPDERLRQHMASHSAANASHATPSRHLLVLPQADLDPLRERFHHTRVLYLGHPVMVQLSSQDSDIAKETKAFLSECAPLNLKDTEGQLGDKPFNREHRPVIHRYRARLRGNMLTRVGRPKPPVAAVAAEANETTAAAAPAVATAQEQQ